MRDRRYLCENMELNGTRFGYHGRGITILLSWMLIFVVLVILGLALAIFYPGSEGAGDVTLPHPVACNDNKGAKLSRNDDLFW